MTYFSDKRAQKRTIELTAVLAARVAMVGAIREARVAARLNDVRKRYTLDEIVAVARPTVNLKDWQLAMREQFRMTQKGSRHA